MSLEADAMTKLLSMYPDCYIARIDMQQEGSPSRVVGPWIEIDLRDKDLKRLKFAVWKTTGAVHQVGDDGAVVDPPMFILGETNG
jgi:hypothetical protein